MNSKKISTLLSAGIISYLAFSGSCFAFNNVIYNPSATATEVVSYQYCNAAGSCPSGSATEMLTPLTQFVLPGPISPSYPVLFISNATVAPSGNPSPSYHFPECAIDTSKTYGDVLFKLEYISNVGVSCEKADLAPLQ